MLELRSAEYLDLKHLRRNQDEGQPGEGPEILSLAAGTGLARWIRENAQRETGRRASS
jgi:hypothetical protein